MREMATSKIKRGLILKPVELSEYGGYFVGEILRMKARNSHLEFRNFTDEESIEIQKRIKKMSRDELNIECWYLFMFAQGDYTDAKMWMDRTDKYSGELRKIKTAYKNDINYQERVKLKNSFIKKAKGVTIQPENKNGLLNLLFYCEYSADVSDSTMMRWYKEANPTFVAKKGGHNPKSER